MDLKTLFEDVNVGAAAKKFVEDFAKFLEKLSENNVELDFGEADDTSNEIDYTSPAADSYKKTYKPITTTEIAEANKAMSEAISGEKWVEGFMAAIQLMLMAK